MIAEEAFREMLVDYIATTKPRLQALGLTRNATAADALVQAAAVRALERWDRVDGERALGPWFWYVMLNLHRDARRADGRTLSLDAPLLRPTADQETLR